MTLTAMLRLPFLVLGSTAAVLAQTWTQTPTANDPGDRRDAAMAFDPATGNVLLFGGWPTLLTAWHFDGVDWRAATNATIPPGRREFALVTDLGRTRIVMFGGQGNGVLGDTWEWDGFDWQQASPAQSPPARFGHAMAHDLTRGVTVLFGGTSSATLPRTMTDTWEWNGSTWTRVVTANAPSEAEQCSMCFDAGRGVCVLTGGTSFFGAPDQKTWEYDGVDWADVSASVGPGPTATPGLGIAGARMVYDAARGVCVLHGGRTPNGTFPTDTWEYDGTSWRIVATGMPSSRTGAAMAFDVARNRVVLYGGSTGNLQTAFRETWEFTGGPAASYATFGAGCPGAAGVITNAATALPRVGRTMRVVFGNLPMPEVAFVALGFSNTTSTLGPLPIDLSALGASGCSLRIAVGSSVLLLGNAGAATWNLPLPANQALVGASFYTQAVVLDPIANALGAVLSDAAAAVVGS